MSSLRRLLGLAAPVRGWLYLAALVSTAALSANVALMAVAPYLIAKAAIVSGFADIALLVTAVRTLAVSRAALRYVERYVAHLAAFRILAEVRVWLYRALEPLAPGALIGYRTGDLMARIVADVDSMDAFFVRGLVPPLAAVLAAAAACGIIATVGGSLALPVIGLFVVAAFVLPVLSMQLSRRPSRSVMERRGELQADFADDLQGFADLLASSRELDVANRLHAHTLAIGLQQRRLVAIRGATLGLGSLIAGMTGVVLLVLAIPLVRSGRIAGVFMAVLPLVAFAAFEGAQSMGESVRDVQLGRASAFRTFAVIDATPAVVDPAIPLAPSPSSAIEFRNVRYRYPRADADTIEGLSFFVRRGGRLAIAGPTGAGKTTIVGLLLRFWEAQSGTVLLGGRDIGRYRAEDVRSLFGIVPQRIHLFNGTLRDNLLLADGNADDDRIASACEQARLGRFLDSVPRGLDTIIGEDGVTLSGGERQRLALARVFLRGAPIVILDEATANLDPRTEHDVLRAVDRFAATRTLLVISHRPASLTLADEMITMPQGHGRAGLITGSEASAV